MAIKIAVLTSGGDSQGMNSAVAGVIRTACSKGIEVFIVRDGYLGLVNNWIEPVNFTFAQDINNHGGTAIGTARLPEFSDPNVRAKAVANLQKIGISALVVIGGDGSYRGAQKLTEMGINCIALPGTIDNDISSSEYTIGFDTAINVVVEALDRIRDTIQSHSRCAIVEVMGHQCGDLALFSGIASSADIIVINEMPLSIEEVANQVKKMHDAGKRSVLIVVSEFVFSDLNELAKYVEKISGYITRVTVLGHTQRGGIPTAMERYRAFQMGKYAVEKIIDNVGGIAVGNNGNKIISLPIMDALDIPRVSRKEIWQEYYNLNLNLYEKKVK